MAREYPPGAAPLPGSWRGAASVDAGGRGIMATPRTATTQPAVGSDSGWTPTVANMVVLIALEIAAYVALRWAFRTAHGG